MVAPVVFLLLFFCSFFVLFFFCFFFFLGGGGGVCVWSFFVIHTLCPSACLGKEGWFFSFFFIFLVSCCCRCYMWPHLHSMWRVIVAFPDHTHMLF